MSLVQDAQSWLDDEKPSSLEIQQSIGNTCHLLAQPISIERREELNKVIDKLMEALQGEKIEVVRPEQTAICCGIDASPLIPDSAPDTPPISCEERRRLFEQLKAGAGSSPF